MATVINEVTVEPMATPPTESSAAKGAGGEQGGPIPPDMQREIESLARRAKERAARLWAH